MSQSLVVLLCRGYLSRRLTRILKRSLPHQMTLFPCLGYDVCKVFLALRCPPDLKTASCEAVGQCHVIQSTLL